MTKNNKNKYTKKSLKVGGQLAEQNLTDSLY